MGRFIPRRAESRTEKTPSTPECAWPLPVHPLFGYAFPLCGMTLRPSEGGTMLAAILQTGEQSHRPRCERLGHRD